MVVTWVVTSLVTTCCLGYHPQHENSMTLSFPDTVERWSLDRLISHARNARTHSEDQVAQIAGSIAEFGFVNPVLVGDDGVIVAGHGRVLAARKLGFAEVPVIVLAHLTSTQRRALMIADNRIAENAGWNEEMLGVELAALRDEDVDLALLGFDETEIDRLLAGTVEEAKDVDEAPEPPADPISRPGDIWICGEHRVLCGDATVLSDVEKVLGGELADICFTDPPYNVAYGNADNKNKRWGAHRPILNDALGDSFGAFLYDACVNIVTVTKGSIYICMACAELDTLQKAFREAGGKWSTFVIWAKNTFTLGRADYQRQYEPILYGWKEGTDHYWCGARDQGDVWFVDKPHKNDLHPTMKPVALVERAIRNSSKSRDIVLDPFGGSGTTMIAAERAGRRARLVELDPKYVDVIVQRWETITGGATRTEAISATSR
jgi:DNA modification methylase